jgi:Tfp pilus assembly protein PilF
MKSSRALVAFLTALLVISFGALLVRQSHAINSAQRKTSAGNASTIDQREAAYRANNLGVALLEQFKAKEAADSFRQALQIKPDLQIARINLSIALYYLPDSASAKGEAQRALAQNQNAPQPHYILGLIARSENQFDDALAEFAKVLKIDPDDAGSNVNAGQIYAQQKKYVDAIAAFRQAVESEPYNETALYNLGLLLTRTGKKEEGQLFIQKFQQFRQSGAGTTIGTNYLEGGHYAEAVVSTGAEAELVDRGTPKVHFVDATAGMLPSVTRSTSVSNEKEIENEIRWSRHGDCGWSAHSFISGGRDLLLFDFDGDGKLDLLDLGENDQRLYHNEGGRFVDVTSTAGALSVRAPSGTFNDKAIAGDYDNDGRVDLFILRDKQSVLLHNDGGGKFSDRTAEAHIPPYPYFSSSLAFVDVDHDGDLDIFIAGGRDFSKDFYNGGPVSATSQGFRKEPPGSPNMLLRNNGNGTFTDITAQAKVTGEGGHGFQVIPTDFDNRRDVDLLVANAMTPPSLYRNLRDGTFRNVAAEVGLDLHGNYYSVAAGDINKDGYTDFYFAAQGSPSMFALSDGKGHFHLQPAPEPKGEPKGAIPVAAQFLDYDNDGLLDLVTLSECAQDTFLHLWRNVGDGWVDVSDAAFEPGLIKTRREAVFGAATLVAADLDGDGDTDLLLRSRSGDIIYLRNDGGNRNHSVAVSLHGRISNKSAVEAKVEMRAGSLYQKLETYAASPAPAPSDLIFGLGKREQPDAVRVLWPAGIVQAETEFPPRKAGFVSLNITELDRKPSSCPYLYTWNGERFEFVTDFMGGGEMGYLEEPGHYNKPDPEEYVRIRSDQLKERDGRFELRVTNELEEAMFVDRLQLLVVAHPSGTEVYPNEGMSDPPKPYKLFVTHGARPPLSAVDEHGHDVLDLISRMDRRWPDDFKLDRIRGYGDEHSLTMKLAEPKVQSPKSKVVPPPEPTVLLLTGWTDYAWSSDNVAATQAGKVMQAPALQVKDAKGNWRTVIADIGIPVGRPQTVTVDLTGKFLSANREVRIVTNMRVYWDQILVDTSNGTSPTQITRLDPERADLHWRGFSAEVTPDGREPFGYKYERVSFASPWKVMTGHYTREGDIRELLRKSDDMFAICRTGDEISLSFDASRLEPLPKGWTRTFLLYADGFSKEMDINSASPDQIFPLPFHGMSRYPYQWPEQYPLTAARLRYLEQYNTRVVTSAVPLIDAAILGR